MPTVYPQERKHTNRCGKRKDHTEMSSANSKNGKPPHCSIVVPAYNAEAYIRETIDSVLNQTCTQWELIVVDDGSTDGTAKTLRSMAGTHFSLIEQENRGVSVARNRSLEEAQGDFVLFLDSDDRLVPTALERLLAQLDLHPKAVAAYGEAVTMDEAGNRSGTGKPPVFRRRPRGDVLKELLTRNFVATPGVLCA